MYDEEEKAQRGQPSLRRPSISQPKSRPLHRPALPFAQRFYVISNLQADPPPEPPACREARPGEGCCPSAA